MSWSQVLEDSVVFQEWVRRGVERTVKQRVERGVADHAHHLLLVQGRKRFGEPPASAESAIRSVFDLPRLDRIAERMLEAKDWDDLMATQ